MMFEVQVVEPQHLQNTSEWFEERSDGWFCIQTPASILAISHSKGSSLIFKQSGHIDKENSGTPSLMQS